MPSSLQEKEQLWTAFLQQWPLESLAGMPLAQYSNLDRSGFVYWLEKKTEELGSIWGGSALKFGIYARKDKTPQNSGHGRRFGEHYGWLEKYGATESEAYERIRGHIVAIAHAAREGRYDAIESIDIGPAVKWKIAFLYQNREQPGLVPIFKKEYLQYAFSSGEKKISGLQAIAIKACPPDQSILAYGDWLWQKIEPLLRTDLTPEDAKQYLDDLEQCAPYKPATEKIAGYQFLSGRQLALALDNKKTTVYLSPGDWLDLVREDLQDIAPYANDKSRNSNLAANAPKLAVGNEILRAIVPSKAALIKLCDVYSAEEIDDMSENTVSETPLSTPVPPLNQILFGPPGTGKTYATIDCALEILDPALLQANPGADVATRQRLKARFDQLVAEKRIRFVTFHQSFSYEDFVEGLRAVSNDEKQIEYQIESGIFKRLCDDARTQETVEDIGVRANPRIWKISIDGTGYSPTKSYCLDHGEARIGWGDTGDLRGQPEDNAHYQSLGSGDKGTLRYFAEELAVGDILLCIHSADLINAVGVVSGDYRYEDTPPSQVHGDYNHVRPVNWLYRDLKLPILPLNDNKVFTLKTVYQMDRFTWGDLYAYLQQSGCTPVAGKMAQQHKQPHVLIIDEINRGNVSRIFGELITLIEPSKREGAAEALSAALPYSKKPFSVPDNVYLIGTMNTADRSLAGLDIALRRRFNFREMPPRPDLLNGLMVAGIDIGQLLTVMNQRIEVLLDRDHCLGHAYFMPLRADPSLERLALIFCNQVLPLLQEYFFEDWQRIQWVLNDHRKPAADCFVKQAKPDVARLFGNVSVPVQGQGWWIDQQAFGRVTAYRGVIGGLDSASADDKAAEGEDA